MRHAACVFVVATAAVSAASVQAAPVPPLVAQAVARKAANLATDYRYYRTTVIRAMGEPAETEIERYDPARADGDKWEKISSSTPDKPKGDSNHTAVNLHRKGSTSDQSLMEYTDLAALVTDADITPLAETADTATYRITSKPGHALKLGGLEFENEASKDGMTGELYVRKTGKAAPFVSGVKMHMKKPIATMVVDIPQLAFGYGYAPDAKTGDMMLKAFGFDMQMKMPIVPKIKVSVSVNNSGFERVAKK
jgi:hypothetical protein